MITVWNWNEDGVLGAQSVSVTLTVSVTERMLLHGASTGRPNRGNAATCFAARGGCMSDRVVQEK